MENKDIQIQMTECVDLGCASRLKYALANHKKKRGKEHVCDRVVCMRGMNKLHLSYHIAHREKQQDALLEEACKMLGGTIIMEEAV